MVLAACGDSGGGGGSHHGGGKSSSKPKVILDSLKVPLEAPLSFVYLSEAPYTGLDLGPWGTALYWTMLIAWSAALAYLVLFNAVPFALSRAKGYHETVKTALANEPAVDDAVKTYVPKPHAAPAAHASHAPAAHHAKPAAPARPQGYNQHDGFRSFAANEGLTIDDIVKGLSRQIELNHEPAKPVVELREEPVAAPAPVAAAPRPETAHAHIGDGVRDFLGALLAGDRDTVFGMVRKMAREGHDTELFVSHAACALDDAYRACIDGTTCHPDIAELTRDCHPSFLERLVSSLTTAVDGSYSTGMTGVKMALTRALGVVQG